MNEQKLETTRTTLKQNVLLAPQGCFIVIYETSPERSFYLPLTGSSISDLLRKVKILKDLDFFPGAVTSFQLGVPDRSLPVDCTRCQIITEMWESFDKSLF